MSLPRKSRVVVVGGGVLGASAAFHLADRGVEDVLLLDRGPIASGTTPFAAGQTGYLNVDRFALEFGSYCVEFFESFESRTGQAIDFRQTGSLRVALTDTYKTDLAKRLAAANELGQDVALISHDDARKRVPTFHPPEESHILHIPRDGYVEPKSVAVAFATAAVERGVNICTGVEVRSIIQEGDRVVGVRTPVGNVQCDWVVLAAGAWARQFGQRMGLEIPAVPVQHQAFVTAPIEGVQRDQPIVRVTEPQIYVRHEQGGLLVGGYGYRPLSVDMNDFPANFEIPALPPDRVYYQQLGEAAREFFPNLASSVTIQERRGLPTISPDGRLLVSQPDECEQLVVVSACGVGGIDRAPGVGRIVADIVKGDEPWIDPAVLSIDRFGDEYRSDAKLRARCEDIYAHHYHEIY